VSASLRIGLRGVEELQVRQFIASAVLMLSIAFILGCGGDSAVAPPRTAGDGTTFQDMRSGNTVITHPNGGVSVAPTE
jgi:hypothetical protein